MNSFQEKLHSRALFISREYLKREAELIGVLQEIDRTKTFLSLGSASLYAYATEVLGLSEGTAYALISVARKSVQVPELKSAIEEKKITLSNARRIAPILTLENKSHWLEKASTLTRDKLELEIAKSFPERPAPTRVISKSETLSRLALDLPRETLEKLKRAQEILAQKRQKHVEMAEALDVVLDEFLTRHDPIKKAKRALERTSTARPFTKSPTKKDKTLVPGPVREALPAKLKHQTNLRDKAQCTHLLNGKRCGETRWLHIHHLKPVAEGGENRLGNLTTLCAAHHRAEHLHQNLTSRMLRTNISSIPQNLMSKRPSS